MSASVDSVGGRLGGRGEGNYWSGAGQLLELASTARANGRDAYADRLIQLAAELLQRAASIEEQDAGGEP